MTEGQILFHFEDIEFELKDKEKKLNWLKKVITHYGYVVGDINYIFCSDEYLLEVNREHLSHDYYTDIITFNYVEGKVISSDLFLSIDRIKENAKERNISFENELDRVMSHGILHLMGYNDSTEAEAQEIRAQEDFCLTLRPRN